MAAMSRFLRRGLRGDLRLQRAAQFHDMQHGIQRAQLGGVDAQRAVAGGAGDEYAAALARLDDAVLAQPRHASRITVRLTPNCSASAVSVGSLSPGCARPSWISASRRLATVSVRVGGEESLGNDMGRGGRGGRIRAVRLAGGASGLRAMITAGARALARRGAAQSEAARGVLAAGRRDAGIAGSSGPRGWRRPVRGAP